MIFFLLSISILDLEETHETELEIRGKTLKGFSKQWKLLL